ncbi:MAG: RusA family crossover junction endodeoxyribonuclease [Actinomycetota bacterium]
MSEPLPLAEFQRLNEPAVRLRSYSFFVAGQPMTQGSKRAFVVKGHAVITEQGGDRWRLWRHAVSDGARLARGDQPMLDGPVAVNLAFWLPKPASAPKRKRTWPIGARSGDLDKLARSCCDSMSGVLYDDDAAIVRLYVCKDWAAGTGPGVAVYAREVRE